MSMKIWDHKQEMSIAAYHSPIFYKGRDISRRPLSQVSRSAACPVYPLFPVYSKTLGYDINICTVRKSDDELLVYLAFVPTMQCGWSLKINDFRTGLMAV